MAKFETIKIEKGMYANKGKSLTDILEAVSYTHLTLPTTSRV